MSELRSSGDPQAVATLKPLLAQLGQHHNPRSATAWLTRSPAAPTLRAMLSGEVAISHDTLDQHNVGQATAYLRSWLVAHQILAPREELLARYEHWAQQALEALGDHPDRVHLTAYARWKVGADYARKLRTGRARPSSGRGYYANLRVAISIARWLHDQQLTLEQTRQAQLDEWLTGPPSRALPTRAFLSWTRTAGLTPQLHVSRPAPRNTNTPVDHATRLQQAHRLLDDNEHGTRNSDRRHPAVALRPARHPHRQIAARRLPQRHHEPLAACRRRRLGALRQPRKHPHNLARRTNPTNGRTAAIAAPSRAPRETPRRRPLTGFCPNMAIANTRSFGQSSGIQEVSNTPPPPGDAGREPAVG